MRLSIKITEEQYKRLRSLAALRGLSIEEYVLERALPDDDANYLENLLRRRIEAVERGDRCDQTVMEIFDEVMGEIEERGAG